MRNWIYAALVASVLAMLPAALVIGVPLTIGFLFICKSLFGDIVLILKKNKR